MAVNRLNVGATNQLLAKASSGQSTNILELQNTAGTTVAGVDANGNGVGGLAHPPTFKNLIINGAMQVAQRSSSVASNTAGGYLTADRFNNQLSSLGTWTQSVENDAPTGSGFRKSLKMLCTTADASPAAGDYNIISQFIEGQNLQQIAKGTSSAKQLTLSFWVKSNVTGTYIAELQDVDNTRIASASYSVSASGTWEKKTITFPADTTGAFDNDNGLSLAVNFWLGAGSTWTSGTLNTSWASTTSANRYVGGTNLASSTNNYWQVTGVQLEVGSTATEFEFLPAQTELEQCARYYYRFTAAAAYTCFTLSATSYSTTGAVAVFPLPTPMRTEPSAVEYANIGVQDNLVGGVNAVSAASLDSPHRQNPQVALTSSGLTALRLARIMANNNSSAYVGFSAEL
jgi:hypothetical protein